MRLLVYSHDTFGLGNICRMLAICKYLLDVIPNLSILLISGSPMLHSFRLPSGLDYIKLPCLNRGEVGQLGAKYLKTQTAETLKLRANLIQVAAINFKPDLFLVDKKPYGIAGELQDTISYLKTYLSDTKLVLLLRDILDSPEATVTEWLEKGYYEVVQSLYDQVLVVGMQSVFDVVKEYQFPDAVSQKVFFCGYIRKEPGLKSPQVLRQELQIQPTEKLVLVTPGGGEDGDRLIATYLAGLEHLQPGHNIRSLIICGPEMPEQWKQSFYKAAQQYTHTQICEFTDDLMSYVGAADAIVSMGGYNTVCEILSLGKRAVVVPRFYPVQEQLIRANRLAQLGFLKVVHPDNLNPEHLMNAVLEQLNGSQKLLPLLPSLDLDALQRITYHISHLLFNPTISSWMLGREGEGERNPRVLSKTADVCSDYR